METYVVLGKYKTQRKQFPVGPKFRDSLTEFV